MCYSNCPYERWSGECRGKGKLNLGKPHCVEDDGDEPLDADSDDDGDRDAHCENVREERRIAR